MTKEKLIKLIDTEDVLRTAVRIHQQTNGKDTVGFDEIIENLYTYISLMNEYCHDSDIKLLAYENYVRSIPDPFTTYEKATHIIKAYEQLNNCIDEENNCLKCKYNDVEGDCRRAFMKDVAEILKMFIEIK